MERPYILEMQAITKVFPGVKALDNVTLQVYQNDIHAICGENGAGKSTLMKVLSGVHPHGTYEGKILIEGKEAQFKNIRESEKAGIAIIHQELATIPELSITENIFMGNEIVKNGLIQWDEQEKRARKILQRVGLEIDPKTPMKRLGVGQQQLVEISKALSKDVKVLIFDEPTSALNETDTENLLDLMRDLKQKNITSIMISHKLNEIAAIADAVTVIRDGQTVETYSVNAGEVDENKLIAAMVGRSIENRYPSHEANVGKEVLRVEHWNIEDPNIEGRMICKDISFTVHAGEIVGFAGLMGAGRTELMRSIFGRNYGIYRNGTITLKDKEVKLTSVAQAIDSGIAYVPEERKTLGFNLLDSIRKTIVAGHLKGITRGKLLDIEKEYEVAEHYRKLIGIKTADVNYGISTLSGGNQQKVVLAKWLFPNPDVLILDEPTRGIDVGAKYEIYRLIHGMADEGKAVILVSSELPELLGMSDRIYTLCEGTITGCLPAKEATQEKLMKMMTTTK